MSDTLPLRISRKQLSSFAPDHETIRELERLIARMNILYPDLLNGIVIQNVIFVAEIGGDYTSIEEALASITDSSPTKRYTIWVAPGVYTIDNSSGPVSLKPYVGISATSPRQVIFEALNGTIDMFTGAVFAYLIGIVFTGGSTGWVLNHTTGGNVGVWDCVLRDVGRGFLLNSASSILEVKNLAVNSPLGSITETALEVRAGKADFKDITFRSASKVTTCIKVSGTSSLVNISGVIAISPDITTVLDASDGVKAVGAEVLIGYVYDGLVVYGNNTTVQLDASKIEECQNDGLRIENTGTGIEVSLFSTTIIDCGNLNFNILNANSKAIGNGYTDLNKSYIAPGAQVNAYLLDPAEDDAGLNIFGELHVGSSLNPTESVFGGGDSYTNGMLVYTESAAGAFTDVSDQARSASGSTFTFPGVAADNAVYFASFLYDGTDFLTHYGIKTKITVAAVKGSGEIVLEYWDGVAWTEFNGMEAESSGAYYPFAKDYFQGTGSYQIRYTNRLVSDSWTKNDPMSLGTSYYWVRARIKTAITTAPVFEQIKLHTNRSEINSDGWYEYFGNARPIGQLPLAVGGDRSFAGVVQNQSIWVNNNVAAGLVENRFTTTTGYVGRFFFVPFDLDTSSPVRLTIAGRPTGTGTVELTVGYDAVTEGDVAYTSDPGVLTGKKTASDSQSVVAGEIAIFTFLLDFSEYVARRETGAADFICLSINASVLTSSNFDIMALEAKYTKWCNGGHIR